MISATREDLLQRLNAVLPEAYGNPTDQQVLLSLAAETLEHLGNTTGVRQWHLHAFETFISGMAWNASCRPTTAESETGLRLAATGLGLALEPLECVVPETLDYASNDEVEHLKRRLKSIAL